VGIIVSCRVKVHGSARDRFAEWARRGSFAAIKKEALRDFVWVLLSL
jgi:hypothetical protein